MVIEESMIKKQCIHVHPTKYPKASSAVIVHKWDCMGREQVM